MKNTSFLWSLHPVFCVCCFCRVKIKMMHTFCTLSIVSAFNLFPHFNENIMMSRQTLQLLLAKYISSIWLVYWLLLKRLVCGKHMCFVSNMKYARIHWMWWQKFFSPRDVPEHFCCKIHFWLPCASKKDLVSSFILFCNFMTQMSFWNATTALGSQNWRSKLFCFPCRRKHWTNQSFHGYIVSFHTGCSHFTYLLLNTERASFGVVLVHYQLNSSPRAQIPGHTQAIRTCNFPTVDRLWNEKPGLIVVTFLVSYLFSKYIELWTE